MQTLKINVIKRLLITLGVLLLVLVVIMIIISPFAKYYVEKHDVDLIGREVTIGWAYVNPLTGYVHLHDVKVYELQGDSVFVSAKGASANFALFKLLSRQVEIEHLSVDHPWGKIVQKKDSLNFDDVIDRLDGNESDTARQIVRNDWHVTLLDTEIIGG